jgi:hypothetical protein
LTDKYTDISACAMSNDGHYWIYDPTQFRLIKITDSANKILESSNVNDFGMEGVYVTEIRERGNYVVLCDRKRGFFVFDNMGQYVTRYEATGIMSFQFDGNLIYYMTSTGLKAYEIKSKERKLLGTPFVEEPSTLKYILHQPNRFLMIYKDGLDVR